MLNSCRSLCKFYFPKIEQNIEFIHKSMQNKINRSRKRTISSQNNNPNSHKITRVMMGNVKTQILPTPIKSESDKKEYRLVQLANGLKALLIDSTLAVPVENEEESEDETDDEGADEEDDEKVSDENMAACSLMVDVGSFSDPRRIQGLSHFLEHMIFMGSKRYPAENEYDSYINKSGGSDNADTDCEETSFYFEVTESCLDGALDRFSSLFTAPLMSRDAMGREKEAVHSEFQTKINNEGSRHEQILASLGNENHPCSIFTWGNLTTLKDHISDDELYKAVHEYRSKHYSSHRMYVCLQARLPLDDLQALVEKYFLPIPNNSLPKDDFSPFTAENAFKDEFSSKVFYVKAKSDLNKIDFTWVLPSLVDKYKTKPEEYVSFLVGHEGTGSLCAYLRRNLLAMDVHAGIDFSGFENNSMYALFGISIILTKQGLESIDEVVKAVFAYLRLLNDEPIQEDLFYELQKIEDNKFKFQVERQAIDNVEDLVVNMKYYEPQDILGGPSILYAYNEGHIRSIIDSINTRTFNVMITTLEPIKSVTYNLKEKWFGTEYGVTDTPSAWIDLWNNPKKISTLHLPHKNDFIATNFEIIHHSEVPHFPIKLLENDIIELWHKPDDKFHLPHGFYYFYFTSDLPQKDAKSLATLNLLSLVLRFYLAESLYPARQAGLEYSMYSAEKGLVLKASGFNDKLHLIVEKYAEFLSNFDKNIEENVVDVVKAQLKKNYHNLFISTKKLVKDMRLAAIQEVYFTNVDKYLACEDVSFEDLKNFSRAFNGHLKIQALIQGNISKETALKTAQSLLENLKTSPLNKNLNGQTKKMDLGERYLRVKSLRANDYNTSVTNYYQLGPASIKLTAMLDLLVAIMEEPLFDHLRTKEQLGYDVSTEVKDTFGILGFTITVHSQENKHQAITVDSKIEKFRHRFLVILKEMLQDDYETSKNSLIKLKALPDTELSEEVNRNWVEITEKEYIFDRRWKEVEALSSLEKQDVVEFYQNLLENETRKLSIQVVGSEEVNGEPDELMSSEPKLSFLPEEDGLDCVTNIEEFKRKLPTYPVHKTNV